MVCFGGPAWREPWKTLTLASSQHHAHFTSLRSARAAVREGRHAWLQAWPAEHVPPHLPHQDPGRGGQGGVQLLPREAHRLHLQGEDAQERDQVPRGVGQGVPRARYQRGCTGQVQD